MPHASSDVSSNDEVKVYRVEGEGEDESSAENLKEEKRSLLTEVALKEEIRGGDAGAEPPPPQPHAGLSGGKHFEYFPPFGYVPGYHPHGPYGALPMVGRVPLVPSNHPPSPLSLMMYSAEQFQPPPAHMGIHIDPKTGMPRPSVFPLPPSQFHPPHVFPPDYSQQYSWHHSSVYPSGFRSPPYPLALSPLLHPLLPPAHPPNKQQQERGNDGQDRRCNFSPSSPFSPLGSSNGHNQEQSQRRAPRATQHKQKKASHIKKPLNAFMLFMKEQRPQVVAECTLKESAAINQILGKKWHGLSREEQSKYYELARSERQMHMQRYPGWTARDNYAINAKKKKRKRDKSQDGDGNNPKKCRARFGLDKQSSWCKPCRRKKKCIRYRSGSDNTAGESEDNIGSVGSAQTPDSRYGAEDGEEELSDTDSGNEDDAASSELSLSSPPLRPPSHHTGHPLNVQLLSQPHTPKTPPDAEPHQTEPPPKATAESQPHQKSGESSRLPQNTESHLPPAMESFLLQKANESHLQRLSHMADPHLLARHMMNSHLPQSHLSTEPRLPQPHHAKDPHLPRPHLSTEPRRPQHHHTKDPQLQRSPVTTEPRLSLPHHSRDSDPSGTHQLTDSQLPQPRQMTDPHLHRTKDPQSHNTKDPQQPRQTTDPNLPRLHHTEDPQLSHTHKYKDHQQHWPHQITDSKLPMSLLTKDLLRLHPTLETNLPQSHSMTDTQISRPHSTKDPHSAKDPQIQWSHQMTDPKLPGSLVTKDLQRLHQTIEPLQST